MKKIILSMAAVAAIVGMSSCSSIRHTSTTVPVETSVTSASSADLIVSEKKISYTFRPSAAYRRTGEKAVIKTAVAEALKANGEADVLVGFQYEIKKKTNLFGRTKIKYVTVEGYPASYKNITPMALPCCNQNK